MLNILKFKKSTSDRPAVNGRRSFLWKMGAGMSTALASGAGLASTTGAESGLSSKVAVLEEEKQLRKLHQRYEALMDKGNYAEVLELFSDTAEVVFNGGVFINKQQGVSRLYLELFRSGMTGKRMESAPGFEIPEEQQQEVVEVCADCLSAKAAFPYSIQVGRQMKSDTSLSSMARLQGEGVERWWEGGVYQVSYVKDASTASWLISRLEYNTMSRADYRSGRSYARAMSKAHYSVLYPENLNGPDRLV